MAWSGRPTIAPGAYPDGADFEALLDQVELLSTPPRFTGRATVAQTVSNDTFEPLELDTDDEDNFNGHSTVTNTSRYVAPIDGWYLVAGKVGWASNATGVRISEWRVNGTAVSGGESRIAAAIASTLGMPAITRPYFLNQDDYIELHIYQNSGGDLATTVATPTTQSGITVAWIGV